VKKAAFITAALLFAASAAAEQKHGIEVYPGAKPDAKVEKQLEKMNIKGAATYRTSDSVKKVTEFYRKQGGLTEGPASSDTGSMFTGKDVTVTVQNPWMDMDTSTIVKDTLISIVKKKR
jgi:hypothetical protein